MGDGAVTVVRFERDPEELRPALTDSPVLPPGQPVAGARRPSLASTRTVERALDLLATVCTERGLSLTECARRSGLAASTALRLLRTLEASEFVTRDTSGSYDPGPRLLQLGATALGRDALVQQSEPALQRIVAATGETAYLSTRGPGGTALYVATVEGTHAVRHTTPVGRTIALEGIAVGLVLRGETPQSGYVAERDRTEPDVTAIAAPIRRPGGVAAALSLLGPTYRISDDTMHAYGRIVAAEAERISALLGTAPPEAPGESE